MYRCFQYCGLLLAALVLCSCGPRRFDARTPLQHIHGTAWSAVETSPDRFIVLAKDRVAEREAVKELCQQRQFVCLGPEAAGRIVLIERKRK